MTDRLQEIRARLDAATPGRWYWQGDPTATVKSETVAKSWVIARGLRRKDGQFIAHAPADIAWLIEELDRVWGYAYHNHSCAVVASPSNTCDCGLNDLESGKP